jgi:hypothetical protein
MFIANTIYTELLSTGNYFLFLKINEHSVNPESVYGDGGLFKFDTKLKKKCFF